MEEQPVHVIRESTRNLLKLNRQHQRDEVSDINRSISELRITTETISNIAQNLKTKSCITASDLHILKNGLMDDPNNKSIVLSTQGALRGLVRELTGYEARKQCAAAGCLCNLALADGRACNTIAKASGSYLITALDNLTTDLAVTCAWTLGNLAGSSPKVCELLISQGALPRLCDLMNRSEDVQDAALYALVHFAYQLKDQIRVEYLRMILQGLMKIQLTTSSSQLLFILSCHKDFLENIPENLPQEVLDDLPVTMEAHLSTCNITEGNMFCCKLVHLLRVLSNMDMSKIYEALLNVLVENNMSDNISRVLNVDKESVLSDSLLWLLGNMYNFNSDNIFFYNILHSKRLASVVLFTEKQ